METIIGLGSTGDRPSGNGALVKDTSTETFARDVLDASMASPVIVDFWAPWCGPCKQLGPALEKAVTAAKGAVRMVKINIDENQELAAQMRIQSIPAVYAFFQGRPVDGFVGALPESQIKSFVERLVQATGAEVPASPVDQALEQAQEALKQGQHGTASALFGQVLQHEPENLVALAGLIRCYLDSGELEMAQEIFEGLTDELRAKSELDSIRAALELASQRVDSAEVAALQVKLAADPADHEARFELAKALYGGGQREAAVDALLEIVRRNRAWNDEAARKELVKYFEAWGPSDPLTIGSRKRLSSLLFA